MKDENDGFNESELIGRNKFNEWITTNCNICHKITFSERKYSCWDVAFLSGDTRVVVEIKDRKLNHNEYWNWIGEKGKLDNLQNLKKGGRIDVILYFNSYRDNHVRIWDITEHEPFITYKKLLPKTTDGVTIKILKLVYDLNNDDSKLYI
tara:strand:+ start:547 stop:996 length:450 start_codon:yes stop_codon:yes gene_type:complete